MQQAPGSSSLVEIVYVLGDNKQLTFKFLLEARERRVGGVGFYIARVQLLPTTIVKMFNQFRVTFITFRSGHILDMMFFPQTILIPEGT
jgi:hypothetical protein